MAVIKIDVEEFLQMAIHLPVIDVRSPGEFVHAHIPNAYSLPLFTDEERKIVGTAYKQESRQQAIKLGLDFFGPKMKKMVEEVESLVNSRESGVKNNIDSGLSTQNSVLVHCWRGGMRSGAVAWLLDMYGFKVYTLEGGYKAFRNWVLQQFEKDYAIKIIGGYTGSAKTELLDALQKKNESVIDLEALANHKGSAFGSIGMGNQPSAEMFENRLAVQLHRTQTTNMQHPTSNPKPRPIWMEDESQRIGNINIPIQFWNTMRSKPVVFLNIPFEKRLQHILAHYGKGDKDKLVNAIIRIKKRLGGLETKEAINFLLEDNIEACFKILLQYYDKHYKKGLYSRENLDELMTEISCDSVDSTVNAMMVLELQNKTQHA